MSFNSNIPVITDPILLSASQIRTNFLAINSAWASNHYSLNQDPSLQGRHNVLTMRNISVDPTTNADQIAIYNKIVGSAPQIFFRPNNNQTPIQMTSELLKNEGVDQYTFMAGPFIVYGGYLVNPGQGQTVNLTVGTTLLFVNLISTNVKIPITANVISNAIPTNMVGTSFDVSFQPRPSGSSCDYYYFAVGI